MHRHAVCFHCTVKIYRAKIVMISHEQPEHLKIVVFSKTGAERDLLRRSLEGEKRATVIYFEKETVCFENIETIQPDLVIAKTDSKTVALRFLTILAVVKLRGVVLIVSDFLQQDTFLHHYGSGLVVCIKTGAFKDGLSYVLNKLTGAYGDLAPVSLPYLGESDAIYKIRSALPALNDLQEPVLITGEKGTGKELLARCLIHSSNDSSVSVKIDCRATGSSRLSEPVNSLSHYIQMFNSRSVVLRGKTVCLLLQDVEQLGPDAQAELLMLMDEFQKPILFEQLRLIKGFRVVATTRADLGRLVDRNKFRKEIYYRLNVIPIYLPPLRERPGDVDLLADYFTMQFAMKVKKSISFFSDATRHSWSSYVWPGNIDELKQWCRRVVINGEAAIESFDSCFYKKEKLSGANPIINGLELQRLLESITRKSCSAVSKGNQTLKGIRANAVVETEKTLVSKALEIAKWNRKKAATLLDVSYKSLLTKIKNYDLD